MGIMILTEILLYFIFSILGSFIREWIVLNNAIQLNIKNRKGKGKRRQDWPKINIKRVIVTSIIITIFIFGFGSQVFPITWTIRQFTAMSTGLGLVGYSLLSAIIKDPTILFKFLGGNKEIAEAIKKENNITNLKDDKEEEE